MATHVAPRSTTTLDARVSAAPRGSVLTPEMLQRFSDRAPQYDRENRFFDEDFEELREAGYLTIAVPAELGGGGYTLRRRLPRAAPARVPRAGHRARRRTCTSTGPGVAADLWRAGDKSLEWLLREAVMATSSPPATPRAGNDVPGAALDDEGRARDGGYRFTGHKSFGSLTPGVELPRPARDRHERSDRAEGRPRLHAARHAGLHASRRRGTCSACAPRAATTRSSTARSSPTATSRASCPPVRRASMLFVLGVFAWALIGLRATSTIGLARRALDLTVETREEEDDRSLCRARWRTTPRSSTASPRWRSSSRRSSRISIAWRDDWSDGVDHGAGWAIKI